MVSYLLIIWDMFKARRILATGDISSAFTSVIANRYLSMTDYRYYCLFKSINANSKGIDSYAFFIYFTLKGWKRLLLAEAPRQVINIVTLEALVPEWIKIHNGSVSFNNEALGSSLMQKVLTGTMAFSVLVFSISFILVCVAAILYIPLFCHIRGNLKEYCCHKVDKRISEMLRKKNKNGNRRRVGPESESFIDESHFKRPLSANYTNASPSLSSMTLEDQYEKPAYNTAASIKGSPLSQQRFLDNRNSDPEYFNYQSPEHLAKNDFNNQIGNINQDYHPRPVAQQLPYQNRSYDYYSSDNPPTIGSPGRIQQNAPSSTCVNGQQYQFKKYPRGY
jgi:hypothetical protein